MISYFWKIYIHFFGNILSFHVGKFSYMWKSSGDAFFGKSNKSLTLNMFCMVKPITVFLRCFSNQIMFWSSFRSSKILFSLKIGVSIRLGFRINLHSNSLNVRNNASSLKKDSKISNIRYPNIGIGFVSGCANRDWRKSYFINQL